MLDFYEAIKYVSANAEDLGVDPARIAMAGESGGGYICSGAMVQLAMKEEAGIVKIAIPIIPMLDDYEFTSRLSMTAEESESALMMQKMGIDVESVQHIRGGTADEICAFPEYVMQMKRQPT